MEGQPLSALCFSCSLQPVLFIPCLDLSSSGDVQGSSELTQDPDLSIFLSHRVPALAPSPSPGSHFLACTLAFYCPLFSFPLFATSSEQLCDWEQVTLPEPRSLPSEGGRLIG